MIYMSRIHELFLDMKDNTSNYLVSDKGADFENQFIIGLESQGYEQADFYVLGDSYKSMFKQSIEQDNKVIDNETYLNYHYISQPFGSQRYPDFLIFDKDCVLCVELKFSKGKTAKPVWNSGLPRFYGLYLFGSYGRNDITFFRGCDILDDQDRELLKGFFDEELKRSESFNSMYMSDQEFGFSTYARKAYQQTQKHNSEAITNFFDNPLRLRLERSVLDYLISIR